MGLLNFGNQLEVKRILFLCAFFFFHFFFLCLFLDNSHSVDCDGIISAASRDKSSTVTPTNAVDRPFMRIFDDVYLFSGFLPHCKEADRFVVAHRYEELSSRVEIERPDGAGVYATNLIRFLPVFKTPIVLPAPDSVIITGRKERVFHVGVPLDVLHVLRVAAEHGRAIILKLTV